LIPFVIKIFMGMLSDQVNLFGLGYRKPYIVIGLLVQCICLLIVPTINPGQSFGLFALMAFTLMMGQALYDTTTDGLALDTTPPSEQGTIQGIMVGGRALGVVLISGVLGLVVSRTSWTTAFWGLAVLTLIPLPFVLLVKESARPAERKFEWKAFSAFRAPNIIALGLLGALYSLIINGTNQIVNPFLDSTYSIGLAAAGLYTTVWGVGTAIGGLTGGKLTDRVGQRRSVIGAAFATLLSVLALATILNPVMAWPLVFVFGLAFGYYETVYFALSMRCTDPRIAASMYAILMAVANIGTGVGLGLSGAAVDAIGYRATFGVFALLNLLVIPLLPRIFPANKPLARS
jgi:PAT family beta-lactamase induction signal transducer AmpG